MERVYLKMSVVSMELLEVMKMREDLPCWSDLPIYLSSSHDVDHRENRVYVFFVQRWCTLWIQSTDAQVCKEFASTIFARPVIIDPVRESEGRRHVGRRYQPYRTTSRALVVSEPTFR